MGGIAVVTKELSKRYRAMGHRVWVLSYNVRRSTQQSLRSVVDDDIAVIAYPPLDRAGATLFSLIGHYGPSCLLETAIRYGRRLKREMRRVEDPNAPFTRNDRRKSYMDTVIAVAALRTADPDIVHLNVPSRSTLALSVIEEAPNHAHTPLLTMVHKHHSARFGEGMDGRAGAKKRAMLRAAIHASDRLVAPSRGICRELDAFGADPNLVVKIPNGVDLEMFAPMERAAARERLEIPMDEKTLLFLGRLEYVKGVDRLIEAFPQVIAKVPDAMLRLVGDGSMRDELRSRAERLGIEQQVRFHPAVAHTETARWYAACDVFCSPSRSEAFGLIFVEAMACARAVVGTDIPGIDEIVEDRSNGLLVAPDATSELAEALITLLLDPSQTERMGASGRKRAEEHYDWDVVADRFCEQYRALVARSIDRSNIRRPTRA